MPDAPHKAVDDTTALAQRISPKQPPWGVVLRVLEARAAPQSLRLGSTPCIIGSGVGCDIVVSEPTVSRAHLEASLVPGGVAIKDLGSRNGTFYLGQRVERMVLSLGSRVTMGATATLAVDADLKNEELLFEEESYRGIIGRSLAMRRLFAMMKRLEGSLVTVLIQGESGVGKELIARALHEASRASAGPLIIVNCGAIPRDLVASELFGHRRGAFTGAVDARKGAFVSADGGTLFLDEIGELPLDVQPMLLRALEAGEVRAVGGDEAKLVGVRVIAATNRDLEEEISAGRFREDLFYRLAVVRLNVPPLRDRLEDIEPLAARFAANAGLDHVAPDILEKLKARAWQGNVRELRNVVQAYAALGVLPEPAKSKTALLHVALSELIDVTQPYAAQKDALGEEFTGLYLKALLAYTGGNQTVAARIAGLDRTYLGRLLSKHRISKP